MELVQAILDGGALEVILADHFLTDLVDVDDGVGVGRHLVGKIGNLKRSPLTLD